MRKVQLDRMGLTQGQEIEVKFREGPYSLKTQTLKGRHKEHDGYWLRIELEPNAYISYQEIGINIELIKSISRLNKEAS